MFKPIYPMYTLGNKLSITLANARVNLRLKLPYSLKMFSHSNSKDLYDPRLPLR